MGTKMFGMVVFLAAATGCASNDMHFEQRSELSSRTSSVVLFDDGQTGQGTMNEQTCRFDAFNGSIIADYDLPTTSEVLEDMRGQVAIARTTEGIHVIDENGWDQANDIALQGVRHVRMTLDGVAALVGDDAGCHVDWRNDDLVETAAVPAAVCDNAAGFAVDPLTRQVWVGYSGGVLSATPEGAVELPVAGDLLAFDEVSGNVFVATRGQPDFSTVTAEGEIAWTGSVTGGIHAMTDMGAMGAVAIVNDAGPRADIEVFDNTTGEKLADYDLPGPADIVVSADASTLALVTEETVFFYDVMDGSAPVRFNEVETEPPPMFAD